MKDSKAFWDKSAPRYAKRAISDQAAYEKKLSITQEYLQQDWSVLEFGCGTGSTAIIHSPCVRKIVAIDISAKMLEIAQQKAKDACVDNIEFLQGTLQELAFAPESFDAVLGLNILHLLENADAAVAKVYALLKPGGVFVSSTALIDEMNVALRLVIPLMQFLGLAPHVRRFSKKELLSMLTKAGFVIDKEWQPDKSSVFIVAKK